MKSLVEVNDHDIIFLQETLRSYSQISKCMESFLLGWALVAMDASSRLGDENLIKLWYQIYGVCN